MNGKRGGNRMPITYDESKKIWVLETNDTAYSFGIHQSGKIKHCYWGKKISRFDDYPDLKSYRENPWWDWNDEIPVRGGANQTEPCLQVVYADGVRDVTLNYQDYHIQDNLLSIHFTDEYYRLSLTSFYKVHESYDLMERSIQLENHSDLPITIVNFKSASFYLPASDVYTLTHLTGMWAHETRLTKEPITEGKKILESRVGRTSHFHNPFFAVDEKATEDHGNVWFGQLAWSGNWKIALNKKPYEQIQISLGLNEWDFEYSLQPSASLTSPVVLSGFSSNGFGEMSSRLHRFQIEQILPKSNAHQLRKVLYNSWEATAFNVNEENQKALADKAAEIGVEIFVVDDGWFGERSSDRSGLGDWHVNAQKFPRGLKPLIDYCKTKGMDFGLWIEPEMVNPDSQLYSQHPEWVLHFPNRPRTTGRNQLMLNLAREDVKAFVLDTVDHLLSENDIRFIKWDMNRPVFEAGWPEEANQQKMWFDYIENLYTIWDTLKTKHHDVIFESCAGGGGRVDIGMMRYADQFWTSDNTDPYDRQFIQEGFSLCYNPKVMMCWVTDWGGKNSYPMTYRFHAAMMGSMGIGADLAGYSKEDLQTAKELINQYKQIRNTVQNGRLYRLMSPSQTSFSINQYLSPDSTESVLICLKNPMPLSMFQVLRIKLKGLEEKSLYHISQTDQIFSGSFLMNHGLDLDFRQELDVKAKDANHFKSQLLIIKKK